MRYCLYLRHGNRTHTNVAYFPACVVFYEYKCPLYLYTYDISVDSSWVRLSIDLACDCVERRKVSLLIANMKSPTETLPSLSKAPPGVISVTIIPLAPSPRHSTLIPKIKQSIGSSTCLYTTKRKQSVGMSLTQWFASLGNFYLGFQSSRQRQRFNAFVDNRFFVRFQSRFARWMNGWGRLFDGGFIRLRFIW